VPHPVMPRPTPGRAAIACRLQHRFAAVIAVGLFGLSQVSTAFAIDFQVTPATPRFERSFEQVQLLVTATDAVGAVSDRSADLTGKAAYSSSNPAVVSVTAAGRLVGLSNGEATITVTVEGVARQVPVTVAGIETNPKADFVENVLPILSKAGCNGGACHASQHGKGGFTLSVMGYDPPADRNAIVRDRMQRRVNLLNSADSLLLKKPTMSVPHGGGRRIDVGSTDYNILAAWIAGGASEPRPDASKVTSLVVTPKARVGEPGLSQQFRVEAVYADGRTRDVTAWARFDGMDDAVISVTPAGVVTAVGRGQAPLMVRYEGQAAIAMVVIPFAASADLTGWQNNNFVDELASAKFRELGIVPSGLCDDATFLRRASFDAIGTLPTVDEAKAFLESTDPEKRVKLIDRLLGFSPDPAQNIYNDAYASFWTLKWADLMRNTSARLGDQGMWALHNWLRESFRTNKSFDRFVTELVTARGSIFSNGPANYFRIADNPQDLAETTSQLFLGIRLQCAKCHHHPFEKYSQADYYGFAAFFSRVGTKGSSEFGNFGGESVVMVRSGGEVTHPRTGAVMKPTPLDGEPVDDPLDRRIALAKWLTAPQNDLFARNVVNRYMGYLLGRGLVDPVDDLRATNPPSNVPLMEALVRDFRENGANVRQLMRTIMTSRLYQLDSQPTPGNVGDTRFYSHFKVKRIGAEALLDAIDQATGVPTKFPSLPAGTRAIDLPDSNYQHPFLVTFGKPKRASVCECERSPDENLAQALHTLNGDVLASKIADGNGRVAKLLAAKKTHDEIVTEVYLASLSRYPSAAEIDASRQFLEGSPSPLECYQDLLWALINSKQFLFVR
jgi:Protein of unknown function (DUF1553)/Protein of unknown function (DUF1549)/Bacterial Ig-like domain (group 2)